MTETSVENILFLLGGYDYEMVIIRQILLNNGFAEVTMPGNEMPAMAFADRKLSWDTATLQQFKEFLHCPGKVYGIELRNEGTTPPANYTLIDHHNKLPSRPAAIEQVITIVKQLKEAPVLPAERELQLIVANDVAHIKGMQEAGATPEEIDRIRIADRQAQGVTDADEAIAARDTEAKKMVKGTTVVYTSIDKFSAITDRLYDCEKLLVYNNDSLCYYGAGATTKLPAVYAKEVKDGIAYSGGAGDGYFGISKGKKTAEEITSLAMDICIHTAGIISVHTFMLPLRWDYLTKDFDPLEKEKGKGSISFDDRTGLKEFIKLLTPKNPEGKNIWKREFYRIDNNINNYNELVYYHAHAANNFFDLQREDELTEFDVSGNKAVLYFEMQGIDTANDRYIITLAEERPGKPNTYSLNLTGISLHVFTTGVAILSYFIKNIDYPDPEDILYINEFGRRIYPPFITQDKGLLGTKEILLADKIELTIKTLNNGSAITEKFARYTDFAANNIETHNHQTEGYYNTVIDFPDFVKKLFTTDKFVFTAKEEKSNSEKISFRLLTSDRMFFQCWYGNNGIAKSVGIEMKLYNDTPSFAFAHCPFWYAFLHGDKKAGSLSIANKYLMEEQLISSTYTRWAAYGTLYGFSKDSFVSVSSDLKTLKANHVPDLSLHMQTMYYQMAVLCLAQRASVLRFSAEVANLADLGKQSAEDTSHRIQQLNLNYIEFINKIYYREITPEIQGIEIYNHFQKAMSIETDVNDLKTEIGELYNFSMMKKQDEQTKSQDEQTKSQAWLNTLAIVFLPASIVLSFFGIGYIKAESEFVWLGNPGTNIWSVIILVTVTFILTILLHKLKIFNRKK